MRERIQARRPLRRIPSLTIGALVSLTLFTLDADAQPRRPFREAVTLSTDAEAARTLLTLEDRWAAGQWEAALDSLIELSETRGRSLVQIESGEAGGVARYVQVQAACDRLLAALPAEGLAAYRRRIEPRAKRLWETWKDTRDTAALERLAEQMFFSRFGDRAVWDLGRQAWDRGDPSAARGRWQSLLPAENPEEAARERHYPDSSIPAADIAARLILCDLVSGELTTARTGLSHYMDRYPDGRGILAGREDVWSTLLKDELRAAEDWAIVTVGHDVPTFAGSPSRAVRATKPIDFGGELWSVVLPVNRLPAVPRVSLYPTAPPVAYHPAVVDGVVYLNDGQRIFAWRLDSGRPAWGGPQNTTGQIFPAIDVEPPLEPRRAVTGAPRWTVTVHGGRLYARMGSAVTTPSPLELRDQRTELVCLDISEGEGRLLWSKAGDQLVWAGLDENNALWSWEGTPLADNGRLYAVLSRRRPQLEWTVVCLDAETGLVLWQRPVGITRPTPPDNENLASQLLLTLADGRLFLSTDGGAIAALDADAGRLLWAVTYESEPLRLGAGQPTPRWIGPPCLVSDGQVIAAPLDAGAVFCLDAESGALRWRVRVPDNIRHLLGVASGRAIVSGDSVWALDLATGTEAWSVRPTEPEQLGYGRGWLAEDIVYWPSRDSLSFIDVRTGQIQREQPLQTPTARRSGGNIVVSGGVLLIAAADRITAYGVYARIEEDLQKAVSQRPGDRSVRRRLAEVAFKQGDTSRARDWLATIPSRAAATTSSKSMRPHRSATVAAAASAAPPQPSTGFWTRAWQRPLKTQSRLVIPEGVDNGATVFVQSGQLTAIDRMTGDRRWSISLDEPIVWATAHNDHLVWATATELAAASIEDGAIRYRLPWRSRLGTNEVASHFRIALRDDIVALVDYAHGALTCDVTTGAELWRLSVDQAAGITDWGLGSERLAAHGSSSGLVTLRDLETGQVRHRTTAATGPWLRPPVWSQDGSQFVAVAESDGLIAYTRTGNEIWRFTERWPHSHAAPWVFEHRGHWCVVIDGLTLVRLSPEGSRMWSASLAAGPLVDPAQQVAITDDCIIAAAGYECRCLDLDDGHVVWSRPLTNPSHRVQIVGPNEGQALLIPVRPSAAQVIECIAVQSGQTQQRLEIPPSSGPVQVQGDTHGLLVATDEALIAYLPQPPTRIAQDR